ncbi:MAG TPA: hypothetical protein DEG71_01725 [Clostridiales bacterium]|nr:hypothetical protein [Clostridiales bacterium]
MYIILKENDQARAEVNLDKWIESGLDGEGLNVLLCDLNGMILPHMKEYCIVIDPEQKMVNEPKHNTYTAQVIHEGLPKATIYVAPWTYSAEEIGLWLDEHPKLIHMANVSLSSPKSDLYDVLKKHNILTCCSTGNQYNRTKEGVSFPADLEWTIAWGAYNYLEKGLYSNDVVGYSNGGEAITAVSCTNIWVKNQDGSLLKYTGTSTSSPFGLCTLGAWVCWRMKNGLSIPTWQEAREFIKNNCVDIRAENFDWDSGYGLFKLPSQIPIVEKPIILQPKQPEIIITEPIKEVKPLLNHVLSTPYLKIEEAQAKADELNAKGIKTYLVHSLQFGAFSSEQNAVNQQKKLLGQENITTYIAKY